MVSSDSGFEVIGNRIIQLRPKSIQRETLVGHRGSYLFMRQHYSADGEHFNNVIQVPYSQLEAFMSLISDNREILRKKLGKDMETAHG